MGQHFRTSDTLAARKILEGQLRECYGRAVYSHKTHEKCADLLLGKLARIKFWQIVLSAVTTGGFIFAIIDSSRLLGIVGASISTILLVLNSYTKDYDLGALAQKHKQAANEIWLVRERFISLITDLLINSKALDAVQLERDALTEQLYAVYAGSPSTSVSAYKKAQNALKVREDMSFTEDELDALLPDELRRSGR